MRLLLVTIIMALACTAAAVEWNLLSSGVSDHLYGMEFLDADLGYVVGWGVSSGGLVLKTENGGDSWTTRLLSANSYLFDVCWTSENTAYVAGCLNGGSSAAIWRTTNSGLTWVPSSFGTSWGFYAVEFPSESVGYAGGWTGRIYRTLNGGDNWSLCSTGTSNVFRYMDMVDETHGFAACGSNYNNSNMIYKTENGTNWSLVKNFGGSMLIGGMHFFDENTGVIVGKDTNEAVLKTYDGGASWTSKHSGPAGYTLQGLSFSGGIGFAVGHGGRVLISQDFGETWELDGATTPSTTLMAASLKAGTAYTAGISGRIFKRNDGTAVSPDEKPKQIQLGQNYPNPFNPSTEISFRLTEKGAVKLAVLNLGGKRVRTLHPGSVLNAGEHSVRWNGLDDGGRPLPSGVYFCAIEMSGEASSRKMILLK
jgi:photosystem II stability/assembly factor-like uncharacterized protein